MSGAGGSWTELSSTNERIARLTDSAAFPACLQAAVAPTQWAELASQSERLVQAGDPLFRLASSGQKATSMRLVATAA